MNTRGGLFRVEEIVRVTGGRLLRGEPGGLVSGVSVDSRQVLPGDLFVALRGRRVDAHDFVPAALEAGAAAALVERDVPGTDGVLIAVEDAVAALGRLAAFHRDRFAVRVVGVTGSVGKTTTKDLIAAVLSTRFRVLASAANLNTEIGLPLTLFRLRPEHQVAVLEMAMRGPGQIRYLCGLARPDVGVLTVIGESHIELLGSVENIARAKGELLEELPADGFAVLNAADPWQRRLAAATPAGVVWYGLAGAAAVRASDVRVLGAGRTAFRLVLPDGEADVELPLAGRHHVLDALAAAAVGHVFGLDAAAVAAGLAGARPTGGRAEIVGADGLTIIDDTYNASPTSMRAALAMLAETAPGRKVAVLGDMGELGNHAEEGHRAVGREAAAQGVDLLVTVGEKSRWIAAAAVEAGLPTDRTVHFPDVTAAAAALRGLLTRGDTVLVKASRSMRMEEITAVLRRGFPAGESGRGDAVAEAGKEAPV